MQETESPSPPRDLMVVLALLDSHVSRSCEGGGGKIRSRPTTFLLAFFPPFSSFDP